MWVWLEAVASSILVSLASLICLAMLPWLSGQKAGAAAPVPDRLTHALMAFAAGQSYSQCFIDVLQTCKIILCMKTCLSSLGGFQSFMTCMRARLA